MHVLEIGMKQDNSKATYKLHFLLTINAADSLEPKFVALVCPAVLRVGCASKPIAITDALRLLTDGNRTYYTQTSRRPTPVTSLYVIIFDAH